MHGRLLLAIDQGTTSSRAILFTETGQVVASAQQEIAQSYPADGWVEHDPEEIWNSVTAVAAGALQQARVSCDRVAAIGITNQRETTIVWEASTGRPIYPAIVWQSRQSADYCKRLQDAGHAELIRQRTGLVIDAYFSATKIQWILDHVPGARDRAARGELLCGTVDTWLIWRLTDGREHVTDVSNASRTMLLNLDQCVWDEELLTLFDIPRAMLPRVCSSSEVYGRVGSSLPALTGVAIAGVAGDQQAALFGQGCFESGMLKNTYGTGCFLLMQTGSKSVRSQHGLLSTVAWKIGDRVDYALEGSVFVGGAAIQWLRDGLGFFETAAESESLAQTVSSSAGVYVVPAFVGLGAPYWDMEARGAVFGLTRGTTRAHVTRATLESLAYQTRDVADLMASESGTAITELRVDGGAVGNDLLMQFQADILGKRVRRARVRETTALGAACLAGLAVGVFKDLAEVAEASGSDRTFVAQIGEQERERLHAGWLDAVSRTLSRTPQR